MSSVECKFFKCSFCCTPWVTGVISWKFFPVRATIKVVSYADVVWTRRTALTAALTDRIALNKVTRKFMDLWHIWHLNNVSNRLEQLLSLMHGRTNFSKRITLLRSRSRNPRSWLARTLAWAFRPHTSYTYTLVTTVFIKQNNSVHRNISGSSKASDTCSRVFWSVLPGNGRVFYSYFVLCTIWKRRVALWGNLNCPLEGNSWHMIG